MVISLSSSDAVLWITPAAYVAIASLIASALALIALHILSPEFSPSWRMVSEYANGQHNWLIAFVFFGWALASFALAVALWPLRETTVGGIGLALLVIAGIGQTMGGLFDINHKLHSPAAMIGIPAMCAAAVVVTLAMKGHGSIAAPPSWTSHAPWISFALMIVAFIAFFQQLKAAGVDVTSQSSPLTELPNGVHGLVGWANRLLFATSYLWVGLASLAVLRRG